MYLYEYEKSKRDPYMILYNPISQLTLDYIAGKWWFVDLLSNYGYEGYNKYYTVALYEPTDEDKESNSWILIPRFTS